MTTQQLQFDFLDGFVEQILRESGFESMTEETRAMFVPQFVAEAEQRLGSALIPMLSADANKKLDELLSSSLDQESVRNFWISNIENFDDVVAKILEEFRVDVVKILSKNSA